MIKTAILGGSFDPVHLGHLHLLHCAVTLTDYSRIILIPAKVSNFKQNAAPQSSDEDRLNMLSLAVEDYRTLYLDDEEKEILVSDVEIARGGVSYTYDTVEEIKEQYGITDRLGLLMGDDLIHDLKKWNRYNLLIDEVEFIICPRNGKETLKDIPQEITYRLLDIQDKKPESSTNIRADIDKFESYLSERVRSYARSKNLYR